VSADVRIPKLCVKGMVRFLEKADPTDVQRRTVLVSVTRFAPWRSLAVLVGHAVNERGEPRPTREAPGVGGNR